MTPALLDKRTVTKIILKKNKGLEVHHTGERDKLGTLSLMKETVFAEPESDFHRCFAAMRVFLIKSTAAGAYEKGLELDSVAKHITPEEGKEVLKGLHKYAAKQVTITRVDITYEEEDITGAKLYGKFTSQYNDTIALNGPQLNIATSNYPFAGKLLTELENLVEEAKGFLKGKYTQMADPEDVDFDGEGTKEETGEEEENEGTGRMKKVA